MYVYEPEFSTWNAHADSKQGMTEGYLPWPHSRHVPDEAQR
jgi:hypothetical protein